MEQKLKTIFYAMGAMILAPQTLCAQSVNRRLRFLALIRFGECSGA